MTNALTPEQFKQVMPPAMRSFVSQELMDSINSHISCPETLEAYKENLINYTQVLKMGKFKIESYINAIRYVSFKLMGCTNKDAYHKAFPDKILRFQAEGVSDKDISSYIAAYHKSKLVMLIIEQAAIPTHILNAPMFQQALNVQIDLMMNSGSDKVRCDAANSVLTHLKPPEIKKFELDMVVKDDSAVASLRESVLALTKQQKELMQTGAINATQVAKSSLIPVTVDNNTGQVI